MKTKTTKTKTAKVVVQYAVWHIHMSHAPTGRVRSAALSDEPRALATIAAALRAGYHVNVERRFV